MSVLRKSIRNFGLRFLRAIGSTLTDQATGKKLGKAFLFPWKGQILMIGTGSFWTRAAFEAVASFKEPFPMYLD